MTQQKFQIRIGTLNLSCDVAWTGELSIEAGDNGMPRFSAGDNPCHYWCFYMPAGTPTASGDYWPITLDLDPVTPKPTVKQSVGERPKP